jgi:hypothetical protein
MKKLILIALSILLLASIAVYGKKAEVSDAEKLLLERPEFNFGELETFDLDNDGSDDRYVYTFETEEVAEDLFLDRSLEFNKTADESFGGKIVLRFECKGDKPIEYSHIEDIPKEFAESIDDLEFSVPPDEIIDPDVIVGWVEIIEYWQADPETRRAQLTIEAFIGAGILCPTEDLPKIAFNYNLAKCRKLGGADRDLCMIDLVKEFKGSISQEYLRSVCLSLDLFKALVCKAILDDDIGACDALTNELEKDLCKAYVIESLCKDIKDTAERDECIYKKAIDSECFLACSLITDEDGKNFCYAGVTGDSEYCEKIKDPETREKCFAILGEAPEEGEAALDYNIENWFPASADERECNRFLGALPGFDCTNSGPSGNFLGCWYEHSEERASGEWYRCGVTVNIKAYQTDAVAREEWERHWLDADRIARLDRKLKEEGPGGGVIPSDDKVTMYKPGKKYDGTVIHDIDIQWLYKNCHIHITEHHDPTKWAVSHVDALEAVAKQVIDEKRGLTK